MINTYFIVVWGGNREIKTRYRLHSELQLEETLYKIADISEMYLRVYVSGSQLPYIKAGQKVDVLIDRDKKTMSHLQGVVSWISEQAEFTPKIIQTKEERADLVYAIKIHVKNDGYLKLGMYGEVKFK